MRGWRLVAAWAATVAFLSLPSVHASLGDRLGEFKDCLSVCSEANCGDYITSIPFRRRLFAWTCPSECDYACQHIVTTTRVLNQFPVLQYHGKWPFYRFLGMQEPFSVLFSVLNLLAHIWGVSQLREKIPPTYPLRRYYILFGYFGFSSWMASILFHIRDFTVTEKADYFAAGANVLYGLYSAAIRIFRLDDPERKRPWKREALQIWTGVCIGLYTCHISYLTFWKFDYAYNMTANISVGIVHNLLWTAFAWNGWVKKRRWWQAWPGMIVAWIILAMSMELLDFPPWRLMIDAHSLWHLGTVGPTWWWYNFLIKDAQEDLQNTRFKA